MYNNIGGKIKGLAMAVFIIEAVAAVITGFVFMAEDEDMIFIGLLVASVGPVVAWVSSWLLYGFGEIIEKICKIERNTYGGENKSVAQAGVDYERIRKIENLRAQGLITEEEYRKAIGKGQ